MSSWHPPAPRDPSTPVHAQIRRDIVSAVWSGALLPGEQLPGVRVLAEELGVNRLTVLKAVRALCRAGVLATAKGKGTFVAIEPRGLRHLIEPGAARVGPYFEGVAEGPASTRPAPPAPATRDGRGSKRPASHAAPSPSEQDGLHTVLQRGMMRDGISFAVGFPPAEAVPTLMIRRRLGVLLRSPRSAALLSYAATEGDPSLLAALQELLCARGLSLGRGDGVVVTGGGQQSISLCLDALLRPGEAAAIESPGYMGVIAACRAKQIPMVAIPVDRGGLNPERLESALRKHQIGVLYTVPSFQNPTGVTQRLVRRRQILDIAQRHRVRVIEDDAYGDLRFGGHAVSPYKSLPGSADVVYVSSFSKSLAPGLRVGFLVASGAHLEALRRCKEVADISTGALVQGLCADLLTSGFYCRHLARVRRLYRARRDAMLAALEEHFSPFATFTRPKGGLHLWVMLDRPLEMASVEARALAKQVTFSPGALFFCDARRSSCLRLNYSSQDETRIAEGVRRLASCIKEVLR